MVFTRKDGDFHGRTVSLPEGICCCFIDLPPTPELIHQTRTFHDYQETAHCCEKLKKGTRDPETDKQFAPENRPFNHAPKGNVLVFQPSIFRCFHSLLVSGRISSKVWNLCLPEVHSESTGSLRFVSLKLTAKLPKGKQSFPFASMCLWVM